MHVDSLSLSHTLALPYYPSLLSSQWKVMPIVPVLLSTSVEQALQNLNSVAAEHTLHMSPSPYEALSEGMDRFPVCQAWSVDCCKELMTAAL